MPGVQTLAGNPKLQQQVQQMAEAGICPADIARIVGMHRSSIGRYLDKVMPEMQEIRQFADHRADLLTRQGALAHSIASKIMESMEGEDLSQLSVEQKAKLLIPLAAQQDRAHQQERLERGQSTANVALTTVDLSEFKPIKE